MIVNRDDQAPSNDHRPTTLDDVAKLAGVSMATASKAINGRDQVAPATRQRVMEAASRLSFTPNPVARSLLAGRTGTVGLLASDLEGRFMIPILAGAEDAFGAGQINVFLCDGRGDAIREQHHLRALLNRRVDGIIVVGDDTDPRPSLGSVGNTPVVYAYAPSEDPADLSFTPDGVDGGRKAVDHLIAIGRRRIAHVAGDATYSAARDRAKGVVEGLRSARLDLVGPTLFGTWSEQWGRDATALLMEQHPDIDGIICGSDQIARGALDSLRDLGHPVPQQVAVVGYDNWKVLALNSRPHLTTIDSDLGQLGRNAATAIFRALAGETLEGGVRGLPGNLVIRGSSILHR